MVGRAEGILRGLQCYLLLPSGGMCSLVVGSATFCSLVTALWEGGATESRWSVCWGVARVWRPIDARLVREYVSIQSVYEMCLDDSCALEKGADDADDAGSEVSPDVRDRDILARFGPVGEALPVLAFWE